MSIPSDPLKPPQQHIPPAPLQQPATDKPATSYVDPTGAWAKFLSGPGGQATAEDVKMFLNGMLKMFNVLIQQQQRAAKRAADVLKKAAEGDS
jgi:hypothetical protein